MRRCPRGDVDSLLLVLTRQDPVWFDDRQRELQRFLILDARSVACRASHQVRASTSIDPARSPGRAGASRGRADEVGRVDLDLLAVLRAHLVQGRLGLM